MSVDLPELLNLADRFLGERVSEGKGDKIALIAGDRRVTYAEVKAAANRFANVLGELGVDPEQRVLIGLPDLPEFVFSLFGTLANGSAVVMVNTLLKEEEIAYFYQYTRAKVAVVHRDQAETFARAAAGARDLKTILVVGGAPPGLAKTASFEDSMARASADHESYPTHRDDPAIWLFSGGTTGRPKAVVQTHGSFANTTELYAKRVLGYSESDVTLSVPKLYFGYATGSNLLFPFSVGGTSILFPERCTADALFEQIRRHRPSILINVPTMVNHMVSHPAAGEQDLSCLRFATSAGEALPVELYQRWKETFGVELLDGLGTAEMWHVFMTNRPGDVTPGTLGKVVPGFEVRVRDDEDRDLPDGEVGWLWVKGASRAIAYVQNMEKTASAFRGEWYVSGDMVSRDEQGNFTYAGRGDDMLKVGGKWLAPAEVENCLLQHPAVKEAAVVGVPDEHGLVKPHAFVAVHQQEAGLAEQLRTFVRDQLEPYKAPREIVFMDMLPRTHLGKVDRGRLRRG
ncbi:MAG: benzoate-CoA ligase family protein [Myxococcales bacterium]|nr:benzoate-CoA ligase family protein [Myxococcales bacterium]